MKLSLRQAAQQAGVSKSTILRAVQKGRISADRTDAGGYSIDPSEIDRVYGDRVAQQSATTSMGQDAPEEKHHAMALLQVEIEGLRAQLDLMQSQIGDLKDQRDDAREERMAWRKQAESAQRLLADTTAKRRWWSRSA